VCLEERQSCSGAPHRKQGSSCFPCCLSGNAVLKENENKFKLTLWKGVVFASIGKSIFKLVDGVLAPFCSHSDGGGRIPRLISLSPRFFGSFSKSDLRVWNVEEGKLEKIWTAGEEQHIHAVGLKDGNVLIGMNDSCVVLSSELQLTKRIDVEGDVICFSEKVAVVRLHNETKLFKIVND
jgi:hypothetical protein